MRYHYEEPSIYFSLYGELYICDHPIYDACTLFKIRNKGLAVIQQRFDYETKSTWWSEIDPWIVDQLYLNKNFKSYFDKYAKKPTNDGLYPTVTIRQIMHKLGMKPLKKDIWETAFDHSPILQLL